MANACRVDVCLKNVIQILLFTLWDTKLTCSRQNFECTAALGFSASPVQVCSCTKLLMQCLKRGNCDSDERNLAQVSDRCLTNRCSATDCGLCEMSCNTTVLACSEAFLDCQWVASTRLEKCRCAADFYQCTKNGACHDAYTLKMHSDMCLAQDCSASKCGLQDEQPHISNVLRQLHRMHNEHFTSTR